MVQDTFGSIAELTVFHLCTVTLGFLAPDFNATGIRYAEQIGVTGLSSPALRTPADVEAAWKDYVGRFCLELLLEQ